MESGQAAPAQRPAAAGLWTVAPEEAGSAKPKKEAGGVKIADRERSSL